MNYIVEYQTQTASGEWIDGGATFNSLDKAAEVFDEIAKNPRARALRIVSEEKKKEEEAKSQLWDFGIKL